MDTEWQGLTVKMMRDIYSVHKVFMFGAFKFKLYSPSHFRDDMSKTENEIFGKRVGSDFVLNDNYIRRLSLYPTWLIRDDMFQIFALQFAVSDLVNSLESEQIGDGLSIHCIVIPQNVVSLYDHEVEYKWPMEDVAGFLKHRCTRSLECCPLEMNTLNLEDVKECILETRVDFTQNDSTQNIVILVDRRDTSTSQWQHVTIYFFRDSNSIDIDILRRSKLLELEYELVKCGGSGSKLIRSYFHFGDNQNIRFWPEQLVWFIPQLFLIDTDKAHKHLKRIYSDEYRHGFRANLNDPVFDKYYKMLTGWDHVTVNYHRPPRDEEKGMSWGFRDFAERNMAESSVICELRGLWMTNDYDSEAIFQDVALQENNTQSVCDEHAVERLNEIIDDFRGWKTTKCSNDNVLELSECQFVNDIVQNLQAFRDEKYEVNPDNFTRFDHYSTIRGMGHLIDVHGLLSSENGPKVRSWMRHQIGCAKGNECHLFRNHCTRRQMRYDREVLNENEDIDDNIVSDVRSVCSVTLGSVSIAHCNLLHSEQDTEAVMKMLKSEGDKFDGFQYIDDEAEDDDDDGDAPLSIDWGVNVCRWLPFGIKPRFPSFLDELMRKPDSPLNLQKLEEFKMRCIPKLIDYNYTMEEILCLKLYTDFTKYQALFGRSHWNRTELETKRDFYQWAMKMYQTFLYHARPIKQSLNPKIPINLYSGLNQMFMVENVQPMYQGPFSTTKTKAIARGFSKGVGLVFTLKVCSLAIVVVNGNMYFKSVQSLVL